MLMFHGTSHASAKIIGKFGFQLRESSLSVDNQGRSSFINAVFMSPNREIAYIYESNSKSTNSTGNPVIIELELLSDNIFDLSIKDNQDKLWNYICEGGTVNSFLKENNYDGIRQIHYNYFGRKRYEYAIINLDILNILNIPKESTDYMSLYSEAMLED